MKVNGSNGVGATSGARPSRAGASGGGFSISTPAATQGPAQAGPASSVSALASVDALLALQDVGGPLERKRRAMSRAGRILDVLDDVKLALLGGELTSSDLERLRRAIREQRDNTDDPGLEGVLDEIETRAAVEMAKLEVR
jgi:hypothetical protein